MDATLTAEIRAAHAASKGTYGAPHLQIDLAEAGIRIVRKRVARLMRSAGLAGVSRRRHKVTTVRDGARQAPDLVDRDFTAERLNTLWVPKELRQSAAASLRTYAPTRTFVEKPTDVRSAWRPK